MKKKIFVLLLIFCGTNLMAQIPEDDIQVKKLYTFYKWYIKNANTQETTGYMPMVEKGKKGYAILTLDSYCDVLTKSGYFTTGFVETEKKRLQPCADQIAQMKYSVYQKTDVGGFPEACEWFYYDRWFNAQDRPDRINVTWTRSLTENSIEAFFVFETGDEKNVSQWDTKCKAIMEFEEGSWRIDALEFN